MEKLQLSINGMSCGHCVSMVKQTLAALPGVQVDAVEIGTATVTFDSSVESAEQIAHAVSEAGYPAHVR